MCIRDRPKTKEMVKMLENINAGKKALIVMAEKDENTVRSAANIQGDVYKRQRMLRGSRLRSVPAQFFSCHYLPALP